MLRLRSSLLLYALGVALVAGMLAVFGTGKLGLAVALITTTPTLGPATSTPPLGTDASTSSGQSLTPTPSATTAQSATPTSTGEVSPTAPPAGDTATVETPGTPSPTPIPIVATPAPSATPLGGGT